MLLALRVSNFLSIQELQELSLIRDPRLDRPEAVDKTAGVAGWDLSVNSVAGIYGANASGKTNFIKALAALQKVVRGSFRAGPEDVFPVTPFLLDPESAEQATMIEIEVRLAGVRYQYGFSASRKGVQREWLYAYPGTRRQTWFERDESAVDVFYFGKHFSGPNRTVSEVVRSNSLFLSAAASLKHDKVMQLYRWIIHEVTIHLASEQSMIDRQSEALRRFREDPDSQAPTMALVTSADLGIQDVDITQEKYSPGDRSGPLPILLHLSSGNGIRADSFKRVEEIELDRLFPINTRVRMKHRSTTEGELVPLEFEDESVGTRTLFNLATLVVQALRDGSLLVVDEIDTSLHTRLVSEIITLFQRQESNPRQAQLLLTSHDTTLLGSSSGDLGPALYRDQVWFADKDTNGATQLYPLTDFRPRKLENVERGYLQGRYGGVPVLGGEDLLAALRNHGVAQD